MQLKQQDHQLDLEKFGWQQKYQTAALNRQYDTEQRMATYQDRMASNAEKRLNFEMSKSDASVTHADELLTGLSEIAQDPETPMGSPAWWNKAIAKRSQVPYTKETEKVWKQFSIDANRNAIGLNRDANMLMRSLQTSLQQGHSPGSDPFDIGDLQRDPSEWRSGKNPQGQPTKFIADIKIPDPNDPAKFRYEAIDKAKEDELIKAGQSSQIRYRTTPASNYTNWMDTYKHVQRLGSGKISDQAVPIPNATGRVRVKAPDGSVGTLPMSQLAEALDAGYTQE